MTPSGSIFFEDDYGTLYRADWSTIGGLIDMTSTIYTPYVWGEEAKGYVKDGIVYRWGIITTTRQILRVLADGYEIVAEGVSQLVDYFQTNFPCEIGPQDTFANHLSCGILDKPYIKVLEGSHWADPDDPDDVDAIWGDVASDGEPLESVTLTGVADILTWIDVWS